VGRLVSLSSERYERVNRGTTRPLRIKGSGPTSSCKVRRIKGDQALVKAGQSKGCVIVSVLEGSAREGRKKP